MSRQNIELVGWQPSVKKVSCTRLLQASCHLGLRTAKAVTDAMLAGEHPTVNLASEAAAQELILQLAALGVAAKLSDNG